MAAISQAERAADIRSQVIAQHQVVRRARARNVHRGALVAGNQITGGGVGSADRGVAGSPGDLYPLAAISQAERAGHIGANLISLDHITGGQRAVNEDAVRAVARNDVAGVQVRAADEDVGRIVDLDPIECVAQRDGATGVGPNQVALNQSASRPQDCLHVVPVGSRNEFDQPRDHGRAVRIVPSARVSPIHHCVVLASAAVGLPGSPIRIGRCFATCPYPSVFLGLIGQTDPYLPSAKRRCKKTLFLGAGDIGQMAAQLHAQ